MYSCICKIPNRVVILIYLSIIIYRYVIITIVSKKLGISIKDGKGYRALTNVGKDGGQEVSHLHFHLFGGEKVGKIVS